MIAEIPSALDCSGFMRELWYYASNRQVIPDGSANQREWARGRVGREILREHPGSLYSKACKNRGALLLCFIDAVDRVHAGHVWMVLGGYTMECYGGHGVGRRLWNTPVLTREVSSVFVVR